MKEYRIYLKEPVEVEFTRDRWNKKTEKWESVSQLEERDEMVFFSLAEAKRFIKKIGNKYQGSSITQIYANGDWVNLGEINLKGNNKHFIANSRQTREGY